MYYVIEPLLGEVDKVFIPENFCKNNIIKSGDVFKLVAGEKHINAEVEVSRRHNDNTISYF